ncbi:ParA family protein [Natronospira bacteriovora]|uniref:ParA family protein n=1 Tax=Natronospira bacteriovora TaxID=3069753 RepID=A0ABU0W5W4_9GAMM|nr:ParA family protein [Natronospira sp. AB-CW4]MDQ2069417.1 ParA family protein [Natronospira sp. AB-CW4]
MDIRPRTIAITNRKGGSGKTTTAVNVAAELTARDARVLIIDLDPQNHVAIGLGLQEDVRIGSHCVFAGKESQLSQAIHSTPTGVDVIPADPAFDGSHPGGDWHRLRRALCHPAFEPYDVIILDTPPSMDSILMNALMASGSVLVPLIPHHLAAAGVRALSRLFMRASLSGGHQPNLLGILPVMVDRRVRLQRSVLDELAAEFGATRILRGIRSDIRLAEAFGEGRPVRDVAPRSRGSMDYFLVAEALVRGAGLPNLEHGCVDVYPKSQALQGGLQ